MPRLLPTFSSLRAFEAFARHNSLSGAATELSISPSAVSHQIRSLENFLGAKLYIRDGTAIEMTAAGKDYLKELSQALGQIEAATAQVARDHNPDVLIVNTYQTLAQMWLIPLLQDYRAQHPNVAIRLVSTPDEIDLTASNVDLSIRHFTQAPDAYFSMKLFEEWAQVVASPAYLESAPPIKHPQDFFKHALIDCTWQTSEWSWFLDELGATGPQLRIALSCDQRSQALTAAAAGLGLALDRTPNGASYLKQGVLRLVGKTRVPTGGDYYLVASERSAHLPQVASFRDWLSKRARAL